MDVKRDPAILKKKKIRQGILAGVAVIAVISITVAVSRLEPAAPSVPESTLWFGNVVRGDLVIEVRGAGTLVPVDIRWITATAPGRVERIILQPGAQLEVGTPILELSNPDLRQSMNDAELSWRAAEAQLENQQSTMETNLLQLENAVANARADLQVAEQDLAANRELLSQGLVAQLTVSRLESQVAQRKNALDLATKRVAAENATTESQLAPQRAVVNQRKADYERIQRQVSELIVRSPMEGQLQVVNVEVGASVGLNQQLVRVSNPTELKANIRISETQTRELTVGLPAEIDTRSGKVRGHVSRIDPAAVNGTVGVDVTLEDELPPGARPDLSVDGVVQISNLTDVLKVESPSYGQENSKIALYKVDPVTKMAYRTQVTIGRRSVQFVQVLDGLQAGDRVILSDMSAYDSWDRIQIN